VRVGIFLALAACAPAIDGPVERQRAIDREDSAHLSVQLAHLPGVVQADAALHRPTVDPLTQLASPASAAIVLVVDDRADRAAVMSSARQLARATAPEIPEPMIAVELGATRPTLAPLGPFSVEASSKPYLRGLLAALLALLAVCAAYIAWRERYRRRGSSAQ